MHFFIPDKHLRDQVTLFTSPVGPISNPPNPRIRAASAQGEFNLLAVKFVILPSHSFLLYLFL